MSTASWLWIVGTIFIFRRWCICTRASAASSERGIDCSMSWASRVTSRCWILGCGRGAVLLAAARRLPRGRAVGIDVWRSVDQSGNAEALTAANARCEGLEDRVELHTANMLSLPLDDDTFGVVVSSSAIHNLASLRDRLRALDEAMRVLRPGRPAHRRRHSLSQALRRAPTRRARGRRHRSQPRARRVVRRPMAGDDGAYGYQALTSGWPRTCAARRRLERVAPSRLARTKSRRQARRRRSCASPMRQDTGEPLPRRGAAEQTGASFSRGYRNSRSLRPSMRSSVEKKLSASKPGCSGLPRILASTPPQPPIVKATTACGGPDSFR